MVGRLHFVTGKGGVGKSTVAGALALGLARHGRRVLAIELFPPGGLGRMLGARPEGPGDEVSVAGGITWTYFDGEAALAEYLRRRVRLGSVLDKVFAHPLYQAFVDSAPGLRELMAIGKVRDELRRIDGLRRRWDAIVVDAGATGHALEHLAMPLAAEHTFRVGLVHREASRIAALLQDPGHTAVHVVALPEEMPLQEAAEVVARLDELGLPLGHLVVNRCREPAPPGLEEVLGRLDALALPPDRTRVRDAIRTAACRALGWVRIQQEGIAELERRTGRTVRRLPLVAADPFGRTELESLAPLLEERSGGS